MQAQQARSAADKPRLVDRPAVDKHRPLGRDKPASPGQPADNLIHWDRPARDTEPLAQMDTVRLDKASPDRRKNIRAASMGPRAATVPRLLGKIARRWAAALDKPAVVGYCDRPLALWLPAWPPCWVMVKKAMLHIQRCPTSVLRDPYRALKIGSWLSPGFGDFEQTPPNPNIVGD